MFGKANIALLLYTLLNIIDKYFILGSIVQLFVVFLIKSTSKSFIIVYNLIVKKNFKICKNN